MLTIVEVDSPQGIRIRLYLKFATTISLGVTEFDLSILEIEKNDFEWNEKVSLIHVIISVFELSTTDPRESLR